MRVVLFLLLALSVGSAGDGSFLTLVASALRGRGSAVRILVRLLLPVVRARVTHFVARRPARRIGAEDVDDLVQDIWLKLLEDDGRLLRAYDAERGASPEGYVGLLVQRELWNRLQAELAQKRGAGQIHAALDDVPTPTAPDADPERVAESRELLAAMSAHLALELPARGRDVLQLLYTDGLSPEDAAARLGVNLQVVYNWQHKIRQCARGFLATT